MGEAVSKFRVRHPEFTEEDLKRIQKLAGFGLTQEKIADVFNMHRNTFQNRMEKHPEVRLAYDRGIAQAEADVTEKAYEMAMSGEHPSMTMFWLKCRAKWKDTTRHEIHTKTTIEDLVNGAAQLEARDVTPDKAKDE